MHAVCQGWIHVSLQRHSLQQGCDPSCWTLRQLRQERLLLGALLGPVGQRLGQAGRAGLLEALPQCRGDWYASFEPQPLPPYAYNDARTRWHAWTCTGEASEWNEITKMEGKQTSNYSRERKHMK